MTNNENRVLRTVYLPKDVDARVRGLAFRMEMSKGDLLLILIEEGLKARSEWRLIDTAPHDGSPVDLFDGKTINRNCRWGPMELDDFGWANSTTGFTPTHWRPSPACGFAFETEDGLKTNND